MYEEMRGAVLSTMDGTSWVFAELGSAISSTDDDCDMRVRWGRDAFALFRVVCTVHVEYNGNGNGEIPYIRLDKLLTSGVIPIPSMPIPMPMPMLIPRVTIGEPRSGPP